MAEGFIGEAAYAAVSLGLLPGSQSCVALLCHEPARQTVVGTMFGGSRTQEVPNLAALLADAPTRDPVRRPCFHTWTEDEEKARKLIADEERAWICWSPIQAGVATRSRS